MTWAAFERSAYQAARSWGIQPSEFWALPINDWWIELDAKIEESNRLKEMAEGHKKQGGGFSRAEWDDARKRHKAKHG